MSLSSFKKGTFRSVELSGGFIGKQVLLKGYSFSGLKLFSLSYYFHDVFHF